MTTPETKSGEMVCELAAEIIEPARLLVQTQDAAYARLKAAELELENARREKIAADLGVGAFACAVTGLPPELVAGNCQLRPGEGVIVVRTTEPR